MEIEFNPSRIGSTPAASPAAKSQAPAAAADSASLDQTSALKAALDKIPDVRPEKVAAAKALLADAKFPPDEILKAVATLIAQKME